MDAVTLDGMLGELRTALVGRHLARVRIAGPHAVSFEVAGERDAWLWLEAGREIAGLFLLDRADARELQALAGGEAAAAGRTRQALLLLRKHVSGSRVRSLGRIPGERVIVIDAGDALLALRLSGKAPALTLVVDKAPVATLGEGPPAWPLPEPAPERDFERIGAEALARAFREAGEGSPVRAILAVAPALGPRLARELDGSVESVETLRGRLRAARPTLVAPSAVAEWTDAALADGVVALLPFAPRQVAGTVLHPDSWIAAASLFLRARLRGRLFGEERRRLGDEARRTVRRLEKLEAHLEGDLRGMAEPATLRRQGEALLAMPAPGFPVGDEVEVPDPYAPGETFRLHLDPRLSLGRNAERLFEKARRIERARRQVEERLAETRADGEAARRSAEAIRLAPDSSRFSSTVRAGDHSPADAASGPRRYLTSKGLTLLVGRGAKENHHITFAAARPEDVWLHARDVPGAHVVLRDDEGRAGADDLREAAEVAAFFSEKKGEGRVDVHVARRKHIRPGRGGAGRVTIGHSDTLRVEPRDPEGRLRRR